MDKIQIISINNPENPYLKQVQFLFTEMYEYMDERGLMLPLAENGAELWMDTVRNTLGKFGLLCVAVDKETVQGFAHGALKFGPDYLGNPKIGVVTHIFVRDSLRQAGIGAEMLRNLEKWFAEKNVHSIELQVVSGNDYAMEFWEKMGYEKELFQYRKFSVK